MDNTGIVAARALGIVGALMCVSSAAEGLSLNPELLCGAILPRETTIPQNTPGLIVTAQNACEGGGMGQPPSLTTVELVQEPEGTQGATRTVPISVQLNDAGDAFWVTPEEPLVAGASYALQYDRGCRCYAFMAPVGRFTVGVPEPRPVETGEVIVTEEGYLAGTSPSEVRGYSFALFEVSVAEKLVPFWPLARLHVLVDGKPFSRQPYESWGHDLYEGNAEGWVSIACTDGKLSMGKHTVQVAAEVAGLGMLAPTRPVEFTLSCSTWAQAKSGILRRYEWLSERELLFIGIAVSCFVVLSALGFVTLRRVRRKPGNSI